MHVTTLIFPVLASAARISSQAVQAAAASVSCSGETIITVTTTLNSIVTPRSTVVLTSTSFTTTVVTPATVTIPRPASFTAIRDSAASPSQSKVQKREDHVDWRDAKSAPTHIHATGRRHVLARAQNARLRGSGTTSTGTFPLCSVTTTVTEVIRGTDTAVAVDTRFVTEVGSATSTAPTPTVVAACGADNMIDQVDGQRITNAIVYGGASYLAVRGTKSPYDCCVACQTSGNCGGSVYSNLSGSCQLATLPASSVCAPNRVAAYFQTGSSAGSEDYVLSNGRCGQQQQIPSRM